AGDLETAVDMAVDALARQGRERKDRIKNRKAASAPPRVPAAPPTPNSRPPDLEGHRAPPKPALPADAVAPLRAGSDAVPGFVDAMTDAVSVLYRRRDGGLGLIEPLA